MEGIDVVVKEKECSGFKICLENEGAEFGRAFLYILKNELHKRPFGFVEDVFIDMEFRGSGLGKDIMNKILEVAKKQNCYKIIFTSRYGKDGLHSYYEKQGFVKCGFEFRMNFD